MQAAIDWHVADTAVVNRLNGTISSRFGTRTRILDEYLG